MTQIARKPANGRIKSVPNLVSKEGLAALVCTVVVCFISALLDAPTGGPADPRGIPPENIKAPWIFAGIQMLLRYLQPVIGGIALPLTALGLVALVPFLGHGPGAKRALAWTVFFGVCLVGLVLTIWGLWR